MFFLLQHTKDVLKNTDLFNGKNIFYVPQKKDMVAKPSLWLWATSPSSTPKTTFLMLFLVYPSLHLHAAVSAWHTLINNAVLLCLSLRPDGFIIDRIMCNSSAKYYFLPDSLLNKSSVYVCYQTLELIYQIPPLLHISKLCIRTLTHWIHKKSWYIFVCTYLHREQVLIVKSNRTAYKYYRPINKEAQQGTKININGDEHFINGLKYKL